MLLKRNRNQPKISLSVPIYGTERLLPRLLESILQLELPETDFCEVLLVNDGSPETALLRKTVKTFSKQFKKAGIPFRLLEHSKNLGLLEARRTAVNEAGGEYIAFVDSDDTLPPKALSLLYSAALKTGAAIIQGAGQIFDAENEPEKRLEAFDRKIKKVRLGAIKSGDILNQLIVEKTFSGFLCGKLFETELVRRAYEQIPFTVCTMAEDFLVFFFIAVTAQERRQDSGCAAESGGYFGISDIVYNYHIDVGITSRREITDLAAVERICSTASVFTIILSYLDSHPLDVGIVQSIKDIGRAYYHDNRRQLEGRVSPALKKKAFVLLDEWWGNSVNTAL